MDQKREEADMYLFRHGITREKDRAKTRWQKVEKSGVKANSLLRFK